MTEQTKTLKRQRLLLFLLLGGILLYAALNAVGAASNSDFVATNGTFQNYNPVRRLLDGQVPYRDFCVYLGAGHLLLGTLATALLGGSFTASLAGFTLLTYLTTLLTVCVLGFSVLRKVSKRPLLTLGVFITYLAFAKWMPRVGGASFWSAIQSSLTPGNSARVLRSAVVPFTVLLLLFAFRLLHRKPRKHLAVWELAVVGVLGGIAIPWSNDYGFAVFVCAGLMSALYTLCKTGKITRTLAALSVYLVTALAAALLAVCVITAGHPGAYLSALLGTGGDQSWYFNFGAPEHTYLWQVETSVWIWLQLALIVGYLVCIVRAKGASATRSRFGVPLFMNLCSFVAANEYHILCGQSAIEVTILLTLFTAGFELLLLCVRLLKARRAARPENKQHQKLVRVCALGVLAACLAAMALSTGLAVSKYRQRVAQAGSYFDGLDGMLVKLAPDVSDAVRITQGRRVFSSYATALEVETGQFQPSGYDYIIHVLGAAAREQYLAAFEQSDWELVTLVRNSYSPYAIWAQNANWFFTRAVYQSCVPVFATAYQVFWERQPQARDGIVQEPIAVQLLPGESPAECTLVFTAEQPVTGTADVTISYSLEGNGSFKSQLILRKYICVKNGGDETLKGGFGLQDYNLPDGGTQIIPVQLIDGRGTLRLTGAPHDDTILTVSEVTAGAVYTTPYDYLAIDSAEVSGEDCVVCSLPTTELTPVILAKATALRRGTERYELLSVQTENGQTLLTLRAAKEQLAAFAQSLHTGNCFLVERQESAPAD